MKGKYERRQNKKENRDRKSTRERNNTGMQKRETGQGGTGRKEVEDPTAEQEMRKRTEQRVA